MNDAQGAFGVSAPRPRRLLDRPFGTEPMPAIVSDRGRLQGMHNTHPVGSAVILGEAVRIAPGQHLGRLQAQARVERACLKAVKKRRHLRELLAAAERVTAHRSPADLEGWLNRRGYSGQSEPFVARARRSRSKEDDGGA